jgi:hypothetical protein
VKFNPLSKALRLTLLVLGFTEGADAAALDDWTLRPSGTSATITAVTCGNDQFVAVGDGIVLTSSNGASWTAGNAGRPVYRWCVTYGGGLFLAAGETANPPTNLIVSANGTNWSGLYSGLTAPIYGAAYGNGIYLLVGKDMTVLTATNLDLSCSGQLTNCNWTTRMSGGNKDLHGVAYGNGVFVAVSDSQFSMASTNGDAWTTNSVSQGYFRDVAFGNGMFVGVGEVGVVFTSTDGVNWTRRTIGGSNLYRVAFGNGTFVTVGGDGTVLISTNGISWTKKTTPTTATLIGVTYGNGTFVITGLGGVILQSGSVRTPILTARKAPDGKIAMTLSGEIGRGYRVQHSPSPIGPEWTELVSFTNTAITVDFSDDLDTEAGRRFYRAVSP